MRKGNMDENGYKQQNRNRPRSYYKHMKEIKSPIFNLLIKLPGNVFIKKAGENVELHIKRGKLISVYEGGFVYL